MERRFKFRVCILTIWTSVSIIQAGPVERYVRVVREVYPEMEPEKVDGNQQQACVVGDMVYGADDPVPADQPCLKCKCQPPGVHCETTRCLQKPGCKAIHKPNECCPEYQCECEYEGRLYANGERLETKPGRECQVCYCRRGEVQCTEVSCYIRTDCEGRTVQGQCCPKYEHCPPIEPTPETLKLDHQDGKSTTTQLSTESTNTSLENEIPDTTDLLQKVRTAPSKIVETTTSVSSSETLKIVHKEEPKITIHEIIPEVKKIPVTELPRMEATTKSLQGQLVVEEKLKNVNNENLVDINKDDKVQDSEIEQSELSEVFEHPPSVIKIGDKELYLKRDKIDIVGNPPSVVSLIGTETKEKIKRNEETINHQTAIKERSNPVLQTAENIDNYTIDIAVELPAENQDIEAEGSENEPRIISTLSPIKIAEITKPHKSEEKLKSEEVVQLENPAYPPIPEIMLQQDAEYVEHPDISELSHEVPEDRATSASYTDISKILPDILEARNNDTILFNQSVVSWLKEEPLVNERAILPDVILKQVAPSDFDTTTDPDSLTITEEAKSDIVGFRGDDLIDNESVSENNVKKFTDESDVTGREPLYVSRESLERSSDESGENTTPKDAINASVMMNDDASVEGSRQYSSEEKIVLPTTASSNRKNLTTDVEMINPSLVRKSTSGTLTKNVTHEENSKETKSNIEKRKVDSETDDIFQELDRELHLLSDEGGTLVVTEENGKQDLIFKELMDELTTPTTKRPKQQTNSNDPLQKVTDALANFKLKEARKSLDLGIIGVLRDFFTAQYRSYKK